MKTEQITTRITQDQRQQLELIVKQTGLGDLSDHIRKAIDEYLAKQNALSTEQSPTAN